MDRILFWLWHKEIGWRLRKNPLGDFLWAARVMTVYKPLFKEKGFLAVLDEHKRYVDDLGKRIGDGLR